MSDSDFEAYAKHVIDNVVPALDESRVALSMVPRGETDVEFATQLGLMIMMDKPIIAVVRPGVRVPAKLIKVADAIVEGDIATEEERQKLGKAIAEQMVKFNET